jgi:hypothetical protein
MNMKKKTRVPNTTPRHLPIWICGSKSAPSDSELKLTRADTEPFS